MKLTQKEIERVADDLALYMVAFQGFEKIVGFPVGLNFKEQMDYFDSFYHTCKPI